LPKVSKENLSKQEAKKLMAWRRREKELKKFAQERNTQYKERIKSIPTQTAPVQEQDASKIIKKEKPVVQTKVGLSEKQASSVGFVLGNGTSRRTIDPQNLKQHGTIYGCNAIYRSFDPDYLVAVDVKMCLELHREGYHKKNPNVWTNPQRTLTRYKEFNFFNPSKGWSSGPTALWLASQHGYGTIYILGFDYKGLEDGKRFNNIYADTPNYKKAADGATFFGNWMRQTTNVVKNHPHINYIRVITSDNYCPEELNKFDNFKNIMIEEFQELYEI
jgi:hypothetical protein